ncbi:MAG: hypothetical protein ABI690_19970 [Chloroflexota bacterium]
MDKHSRLLILFLTIFLTAGFAPPAQIIPAALTLSVEAGFDGSFREDQWMPVYIRVSNDGEDIEGRLVVRPETSNNAVDNTYSLPINLPQGARKAVFLYITAHSFANQIRVELIDDEGVVVAAEPANLRSIEARDQLYVVVTQSAIGTTDLTAVHDAGYGGFQANWGIDNIPDKAAALSSVNAMMFSDIDTGSLSSAQHQAITDWVVQGGHLLVTGGTNWQATAAGLQDLLPFKPDNSSTVGLEPISSWVRFVGPALKDQAVIATGTLQTGGSSLIATSDDTPLVTRRSLGNGTVDYLAFEPTAQPLRGWGGMTDFWLALASTLSSQPSWSYGIQNWSDASSSANILPGVDLLPDILPLCGFLAFYIALVGPLNYLVLNRINRREFAWVTIPFFIILFSVLAWVVGFNLRGNEATLSRLTVVESWPDAPRARVQEVLGLLSPRRAEYTLAASEGSLFRSIPRLSQSTLLSGNVQISTEIQQTDHFQATKFPVDASFIAAFNTNTVLEKPAISGQATLFYDDAVEGQQIMRGSVRNDTDHILQDPVILVRGQAYRLEKPLAPGDVAAFELTLPGAGLPSPSPISFAPGAFISVYYRPTYAQLDVSQSVKDILGDQLTDARGNFARVVGSSTEEQELYRRRIFLSSFINDPYDLLTGRGNKAYLAAWTDVAPLDVTLQGANWKSIDTTLYLVELDVKETLPSKEVLISSDQFTWMVRSRNSVTDLAPIGMTMQSGDQVTFRFTPLPDAVLGAVSDLNLIIDRGSNGTRSYPIQLWNWENQEWDDLSITDGSEYTIHNPDQYLGPQNAVEVQVNADAIGNYARIQDLSIEQRGKF